jgi:hypothetical protein
VIKACEYEYSLMGAQRPHPETYRQTRSHLLSITFQPKKRIAQIGHDVSIRSSTGVGVGFKPLPIQNITEAEKKVIYDELMPLYKQAVQQAGKDFP